MLWQNTWDKIYFDQHGYILHILVITNTILLSVLIDGRFTEFLAIINIIVN